MRARKQRNTFRQEVLEFLDEKVPFIFHTYMNNRVAKLIAPHAVEIHREMLPETAKKWFDEDPKMFRYFAETSASDLYTGAGGHFFRMEFNPAQPDPKPGTDVTIKSSWQTIHPEWVDNPDAIEAPCKLLHRYVKQYYPVWNDDLRLIEKFKQEYRPWALNVSSVRQLLILLPAAYGIIKSSYWKNGFWAKRAELQLPTANTQTTTLRSKQPPESVKVVMARLSLEFQIKQGD